MDTIEEVAAFEAKHCKPETRMYDLYSIVVKSGKRIKLNKTSMNHDEICTFKNKFTEYPHRTLMIAGAK